MGVCGSPMWRLREPPRAKMAWDAQLRNTSGIDAGLGPPLARVRLQVLLPKPLRSDVRVDLCGGEAGMSQHLLQGTEICAAIEHMGGE